MIERGNQEQAKKLTVKNIEDPNQIKAFIVENIENPDEIKVFVVGTFRKKGSIY